MKLQTKITLMIISLLLSGMFILGMWSIKKAEEGVHKSIFLYMNTVIDFYLSDVDKLNNLLVKNGLNTVDSFVSEYKQNAFKTIDAIKIPEQAHIFILDESGRLVFSSDKSDKNMMESVWGPVAKGTATSSESGYKRHTMETGIEQVYVTRHFKPWGWVVFFAMPDQVVHDAEKQIQTATIGIAGICSILSILAILLIFRKFFVVPINIIGKAASSIATGEGVNQIDVYSKDELGDLARNMEAMSDSIQKHQAEIIKSHDELETRVKERTEELEKALSEIKTLSGILPICSHCKKIRDDTGYWNQIEAYVRDHSDAEFSHGICQECAEKYYPGIDLYNDGYDATEQVVPS